MLRLFILYIKRFCKKHECYDCPLRNSYDGDCKLNDVPFRWLEDENR